MNKRLKTVLRSVVGLLIGTLLIYYLLSQIDIEKTWISIQNANKVYFFIAALLLLASHTSRALRWSVLLEDQGFQVSKKGLIAGTFFGYFINIIIPRGGEVARCSSVSFKYGLPTNTLLGTVILERVIDMFMLIMFVFLVLFLDIDTFGSFFQERLNMLTSILSGFIWIAVTGVIALVIGLIIIIYLSKKSTLFLKVQEFLKGILEGLVSLRKLKRKGLFLFHTGFIWFMYILMAYIPFYAFEELEQLNFTQGMFAFILGGIGMTIPTPGGLGSFHGATIVGFTNVLNVSEEVATAYAFSVHALMTFTLILAGLLVSWFLFKSKK